MMAVAAFEIDDRAGGAPTNGLQMDSVIESDRAGITPGDSSHCAQCSELRMVVFEANNVILVLGVGTFALEIAMTVSARLVAGGGKIDAAAMLGVALVALG